MNGETDNMSSEMKRAKNGDVQVIIGAQWGDEGKGKIVDLLAEQTDLVCRGQVMSSRRGLPYLGPSGSNGPVPVEGNESHVFDYKIRSADKLTKNLNYETL